MMATTIDPKLIKGFQEESSLVELGGAGWGISDLSQFRDVFESLPYLNLGNQFEAKSLVAVLPFSEPFVDIKYEPLKHSDQSVFDNLVFKSPEKKVKIEKQRQTLPSQGGWRKINSHVDVSIPVGGHRIVQDYTIYQQCKFRGEELITIVKTKDGKLLVLTDNPSVSSERRFASINIYNYPMLQDIPLDVKIIKDLDLSTFQEENELSQVARDFCSNIPKLVDVKSDRVEMGRDVLKAEVLSVNEIVADIASSGIFSTDDFFKSRSLQQLARVGFVPLQYETFDKTSTVYGLRNKDGTRIKVEVDESGAVVQTVIVREVGGLNYYFCLDIVDKVYREYRDDPLIRIPTYMRDVQELGILLYEEAVGNNDKE